MLQHRRGNPPPVFCFVYKKQTGGRVIRRPCRPSLTISTLLLYAVAQFSRQPCQCSLANRIRRTQLRVVRRLLLLLDGFVAVRHESSGILVSHSTFSPEVDRCERKEQRARTGPLKSCTRAPRCFRSWCRCLIAACSVGRPPTHTANHKQKAPPGRGLSGLLLGLFEQRNSYPFPGCKEKEERGCCDSTVTHIRIVYEGIWTVNGMCF